MKSLEQEFLDEVPNLMGESLERFGFVFMSAHLRPRGSVIEYRRDSSRFLISCEGGSVYVELIVPGVDDHWIRVDVNGLFYHKGDKTLPNTGNWKDTVLALKEGLVEFCGPYLQKDPLDLDSKFCFTLSDAGFSNLIESNLLSA